MTQLVLNVLNSRLSLQLHQPELALACCDRVFLSSTPGAHKTTTASLSPLGPYLKDTAAANIYLTLLDVYLKPQAAIQEFDRSLASLVPIQGRPILKPNASPRLRGRSGRKIALIQDGKNIVLFLINGGTHSELFLCKAS